MVSVRPTQQPLDDRRWHTGLTLAERLVALNLAPSCGPSDQQRKTDRTIRWRVERRADIARVKEPATASIDTQPWLQTFRTAYDEAERRKPLSDSPTGLLVSVGPLIANARRQINAALQASATGVCPASKESRVALVASFEQSLRSRLYNALSKTLVLELAVASRRNVLA